MLEGRIKDAAAYALRIQSAVAHEKEPSRETLYIVGFAAIFQIYCYVIAMPLHCDCHVIAMSLPCNCHALPCHCHVIAHVIARSVPAASRSQQTYICCCCCANVLAVAAADACACSAQPQLPQELKICSRQPSGL